ncbi:DUF5719 family protein [Nesterenkonia sandarakina]|uniref:Uncharacterized protein n=1 Tax=Nesterenkonia sandarakina TaxID=272918 RepID=A0A2T0YRY6_9MICC|nr:DUF5719 family protein [Nesterenkonia sandarakina]PRZ18169.1 hypothetical protein BCL67_103155 [Nesterenkonia sandarakina]
MSAKKVRVKKLIKEQRRARRQAIRDQERAATLKAKQHAAAARAELKAEEQRLRQEQQQKREQQDQERTRQQQERKQDQQERKRDQQRTRRSQKPAAQAASTAPASTPAAGPADVSPVAASTEPDAGMPAEADTGTPEKAEAPAGAANAAAPLTPVPHPAPKQTRRERRRRARRADRSDHRNAEPVADRGAKARTRSGAKARTAAVVVTAGVLAAMVGSVALDGLLDGRSEAAAGTAGVGATAALSAASVAAPQAGQTFVCPPMPGQPDSLTTDGQLEYRDRDPSASSRFSAVLFATDLSGTFSDSSWAQLNEEGRVNEATVTEASSSEDVDADASDAADEAGAAEADSPLSAREAVYTSTGDLARPPLLETSAAADGSVQAAAALYEYQAGAGPVAGLAVGACTAPERSQWFFGPEIAAGSSSLLTLGNPFDRSATVEVTSVDSEGDRGTTGTRSVVVPGQTTRSVNIAGLASAGSDLGVQVRSAGAPVTAQLQSSRASGLTGTGVEFLPGMTTPGTEHLMPGVPIPDGVPDSGEEDDEESTAPPELWIHVPGEEGATVELQVYGEDGQQVIETPGVFTVDGGEIDAVNLRGIELGVSDIRVRTDVPAYVAVRSETEQGTDFSWAPSAAALGEGSGTLLPETGETELHLFASGASGSIGYQVLDAEGEFGPEQSLELPADGAGVISAEDLTAAAPEGSQDGPVVIVFADPQLDGEGTVHATMSTSTDDGQFSLTPVSPLRGAEEYVPVRLLR